MKSSSFFGLIRYVSTGVLLGLLLVITALVYNYQQSFNVYLLNIISAPPGFILIIFSPILLGFIFYSIGIHSKIKQAATSTNNSTITSKMLQPQPKNTGDDQQFKLLANVVSQINEAVMITDNTGCIQWVNNGFTTITGYHLNDVMGKQPGTFLIGELTQKRAVKNIKLQLFRGLAVVEELIQYKKNGQSYWAMISIKPIHNDKGEVTNYIAIESDITNRKEKEIALENEISERRALEKELVESNNKLEQAMKIARFGTWEVDVENKTLFLSKELRELFKLPVDGKINLKTLFGSFHAEDIKSIRTCIRKASKGIKNELEYRFIVNNKTSYMLSNIAPKLNEAGIIIGYFGTVTDITQRKIAELALMQSEEEKAIVLNNTQTIICLHDMNGVILDVNCAAEKMSGYTKAQLIGLNLKTLIVSEHQFGFENYIGNVNSQKSVNGTMHIKTREGKKRIWMYQNTVYQNNEKPPYIIASLIDITELAKAKNEIERQQQFIGQIIDNSPNIIYVMNEKKEIVLSNKYFKEYYNCDDTLNASALNLSKGENDILLGDIDAMLDLDDGEKIRMEGSIEGTDELKNEKWLNVIKKCFKDGRGKKYILGCGMDITGRYDIESDLIAANQLVEHSLKVKDQFISNMSHEIRTPLNAVIGFTDLLIDTTLTSQQSEYTQIVKAASQNLLALINNILDMSKIESGSIALESLPMDIKQIVLDAAKIFEPKAATKKIKIITHVADNIPGKLLGDQLRVSQIFYNLVGNAIKFTDTGYVEISCKLVNGTDEEKQYISFSVRDTGIGVPAEKQSLIFDRFTQANSDTTRLYGGTGLGLNIAKSIVDLHGGKLHLESTPGKGTVFQFILPFQKFQESNAVSFETANVENQIQLLQTGRPLHILLAEDNLINAMLARQVLENGGFTVTHVENGALALKAVQEQAFDVVLMDIQMPEMNGIIATKSIRNLEGPIATIPIVAMTAHSLYGEMQNCYNAGMNGYISKPFKSENLFATIINVVNPVNDAKQQFFAMIDAA